MMRGHSKEVFHFGGGCDSILHVIENADVVSSCCKLIDIMFTRDPLMKGNVGHLFLHFIKQRLEGSVAIQYFIYRFFIYVITLFQNISGEVRFAR